MSNTHDTNFNESCLRLLKTLSQTELLTVDNSTFDVGSVPLNPRKTRKSLDVAVNATLITTKKPPSLAAFPRHKNLSVVVNDSNPVAVLPVLI